MKRIITPAIFLSASILAAPTAPGTDGLAGEHAQDGETPKADAAHDNVRFMAGEKRSAFPCAA